MRNYGLMGAGLAMLAMSAVSLQGDPLGVERGAARQKRDGGKPFKRANHEATKSKAQSDSLRRMLKRAK